MGTGLETPVCAGAQAATALKAASVGLLCDLDSVANVHFPPVLKRCQSLSLAGTKDTHLSGHRPPSQGPQMILQGYLPLSGADTGLSPPVIRSPSLLFSSSQPPYCSIPGPLPHKMPELVSCLFPAQSFLLLLHRWPCLGLYPEPAA